MLALSFLVVVEVIALSFSVAVEAITLSFSVEEILVVQTSPLYFYKVIAALSLFLKVHWFLEVIILSFLVVMVVIALFFSAEEETTLVLKRSLTFLEEETSVLSFSEEILVLCHIALSFLAAIVLSFFVEEINRFFS